MKEVNIDISETNRGKNKSKLNRCIKYKTLNKCKSYIILNNENKILKYDEFNAALSFTIYKIKKEIKRSSIPFDIKPKKRDLIKFHKILSPFQAFLFKKYCDDLIVDGTFYVAPDFSYQVFITRNFVPELNKFYTTSFSKLRNKEHEIYKTIFKVIKSNSISNAAIIVFQDINIRYCIWHYKRSLGLHKNKIYYIYYNKIRTQEPYCNGETQKGENSIGLHYLTKKNIFIREVRTIYTFNGKTVLTFEPMKYWSWSISNFTN
ncbi:hypothetical protein H8356DRAFT_1330995 [Neocallimastix lanati (nom. inval.)]|nr:hypothetical protein H8356DRAFT_1330995 [Neocallimastix sp. JGI-2020a]